MIAQLRSEWVKTTSTRAWWVIGLVLLLVSPAAAVVLTLGIQAAPAARLDLSDPGDVSVLYNLPASIVYVLPLILGVLLVTGECQSRTVSQTLLAEPRRWVVFAAKPTVAFVFCGAMAVAAIAATTAAVAAQHRTSTRQQHAVSSSARAPSRSAVRSASALPRDQMPEPLHSLHLIDVAAVGTVHIVTFSLGRGPHRLPAPLRPARRPLRDGRRNDRADLRDAARGTHTGRSRP